MRTVTGTAALQRSVSVAVAVSGLVSNDTLPKFKGVAVTVQVASTRA
jgi:hypothetical protein